jgi:hypothetical protein
MWSVILVAQKGGGDWISSFNNRVNCNVWSNGVNTPWQLQSIQHISCTVKPSKISPAAGPVSALTQAKSHPRQLLPVETDGRDINRLNAQGLAYAGYHLNRDADWERRPRTAGVLA